MTYRPALVKQSELTRYVKAVQNAGVAVGRVVIGRDGTVTVYPAGAADDSTAPNPWDQP